MKRTILKVNNKDNAIVALTDLPAGSEVEYDGKHYVLPDFVQAKHKFAAVALPKDTEIIMYGVLVGKAQSDIAEGGVLTTANVKHAANDFITGERKTDWHRPDVSKWQAKTFNGFHREDGSVGTANYWLVIPMVFCENRNLQVLQEALVTQLGYGRNKRYENQAKKLIDLYKSGSGVEEILYTELDAADAVSP